MRRYYGGIQAEVLFLVSRRLHELDPRRRDNHVIARLPWAQKPPKLGLDVWRWRTIRKDLQLDSARTYEADAAERVREKRRDCYAARQQRRDLFHTSIPPARTRYVPIEALEIRLSVRRSEEIAGTRENPNGSSYPPSTGNMQSVFADALTVDLAPLSELNGEQIAPPGWTPEMQANKRSQSAFDDLLQRSSSKRTGRRF